MMVLDKVQIRRVLCSFSLIFYLLNKVELFTKHLTKEHLVVIMIIAVCGLWMCVFAHQNNCAHLPQVVHMQLHKHVCVCQDAVFVVLWGTDGISAVYQAWRAGTRIHGAWGEWHDEWPAGGHRSVCTVGLIRCWGPIQTLGWSFSLWGKKVWVVVLAVWRMINKN